MSTQAKHGNFVRLERCLPPPHRPTKRDRRIDGLLGTDARVIGYVPLNHRADVRMQQGKHPLALPRRLDIVQKDLPMILAHDFLHVV